MKKLAAFLVLLSVSCFTIGCGGAEEEAAPEGEAATEAPAEGEGEATEGEEAPAEETEEPAAE